MHSLQHVSQNSVRNFSTEFNFLAHPSLMFVLLFSLKNLFSYFNVSQKQFIKFCCNFADMFNLLFQNDSHCLNEIEICEYLIWSPICGDSVYFREIFVF